MPDNSYTVIDDHVILFAGRPDELDITAVRRECDWCRKTYPTCGSTSPYAHCPLFDLPPAFIFVTRTDKGMAID